MNSTFEPIELANELLVAHLSRASAYPHSVHGPIAVHETHISWIFLAGHFAYKIKKPITTDFLDYGSLEKRHHACCEELRLDSRYADGLYLEVVPVTFEDGQVRMDGDAQPIDFAVRMRRFAEGTLLSERIEADQINIDEMIQLGTSIADFHRHAPVTREADDCVLGEIFDQAMANLRCFRDVAIRDQDATLSQLQKWTEKTSKELRDLFRRRISDGFIRECHGDLHCDNIVFWQDHWVPFDGIEFNPKYSWIDVLSDISFLVMDLQHRRRHDLSACLLNAYLEQSGDYEALPLLRWYMVYRALVRAKVSLMRGKQTAGDSQQSSKQLATTRDLLSLASELMQPASRHLWITHGVSGSGKTTGSLQLVKAHAAIRLRSDVERKRLFRTSQANQPTVGYGQGMYSATASEATYQVLMRKARAILQAGFSVVVDAAFLKHGDRQRFQAMAKEENAAFQILTFHVDDAVLRRRVLDRSLVHNDASDADLSVLERQLIEQEPLTDDELNLTVETGFFMANTNNEG